MAILSSVIEHLSSRQTAYYGINVWSASPVYLNASWVEKLNDERSQTIHLTRLNTHRRALLSQKSNLELHRFKDESMRVKVHAETTAKLAVSAD